MKGKKYTKYVLFFVLCGHLLLSQSVVQSRVLGSQQWNAYFGLNFFLKNTGTYKTVTAESNIPFPSVWKYMSGGKYRLFNFGKYDYMFMPSNNGVGTYMLYLNHLDYSKGFLEMNFLADSITCMQLPQNIIIFRLIDNEFKPKDDTLGFNRYLFTDKEGLLASKAVVTHGCNITYNSVDTVNSILYFNVQFSNHVMCLKCLRFNYKRNILKSDITNIDGNKGTIILDDVHSVTLKSIESVN